MSSSTDFRFDDFYVAKHITEKDYWCLVHTRMPTAIEPVTLYVSKDKDALEARAKRLNDALYATPQPAPDEPKS